MAHKTKSIDYIIKEIDMALVDVGVDTDDYKEVLDSALNNADIDLYDIREIDKDMFDIDCNDYTLTIHKYKTIQDIPSKSHPIMLGSTFYMYRNVEIAEPCYIGICDIVDVFDTNYNTQFAIASSCTVNVYTKED